MHHDDAVRAQNLHYMPCLYMRRAEGSVPMSVKKEKQSAILGMLFTYLAISKVIYYYNITANALFQGGFQDMAAVVLERLITQDILIILVILLTLYTEKFVALRILKYNKTVHQAIVHIIDYLLYIGVLTIYFLTMNFAFGFFPNIFSLENFIYFSVLYLVIVAVVEIKKYFKKKEKTEYTPALSANEKLAMLKTLHNNNVLTREEYDSKKKGLFGA